MTTYYLLTPDEKIQCWAQDLNRLTMRLQAGGWHNDDEIWEAIEPGSRIVADADLPQHLQYLHSVNRNRSGD
jgi:hypothetical protein